MPSALAVLGAIESPEEVAFEFESVDKTRRRVTFKPASKSFHRNNKWTSLASRGKSNRTPATKRRRNWYTTKVYPKQKALYWRYSAFAEDPDVPWKSFHKRAFATFDREQLSRLVLDLRSNSGGNPKYGLPLLRGIIVHADLNSLANTLRELSTAGSLSPAGLDRRTPITISSEPASQTLIPNAVFAANRSAASPRQSR